MTLQILYINKTCCLFSASDLKFAPKVGVASFIVYVNEINKFSDFTFGEH